MIFFDQFLGKNNISILIISLSRRFVRSDKIVLSIASIELHSFIFEIRKNYIIVFFKSCGENKFV